jgi:hypothetical protein
MPRAELGASSFFVAVTPNDTTPLSYQTRALYVGTAGTLNVTAQDNPDASISFVNVAAGTTLYIAVSKVSNTDTSASNIVALV